MNVYIVTKYWWETTLPAPDPLADTCGEETIAVFDNPEKAVLFIKEAIEKEIAEADEDDRDAYIIDGKPVSVDSGVVGRSVVYHDYAGRRSAYRCLVFGVQ